MDGQRPANLQTIILEYIRTKRAAVTVFLIDGMRLQGEITSFDIYSVALTRAGQAQMIYKQAISTIQPGEPVELP